MKILKCFGRNSANWQKISSVLLMLCTLAMFFLFALIINGCTAGKILVGQNANKTGALHDVKVQLKWLHQAQFAGNYVAKEKGLYAQQGINATLLPFDFTYLPIDEVESDSADFGITGADELLVAKDQGKAAHVKAIAVIYKINPTCFFALKESGIVKPQDFAGKTIGIERTPDGKDINIGTIYGAMMKRLGIDRSKVKEVSIGFDVSEFLSGGVDVSSGYVINEPDQAIEAGKDINIIMAADYGANIYADVIIANTKTMSDNPELVRKFLKATLDGWQYAIENEAEAVNITLKYDKLSSIAHEEYMLQSSIPLINTGDTPIGLMEKGKWDNAIQILLEQGLINKSVNADDVFTDDFLPGAW